jgi:hypothetical protein
VQSSNEYYRTIAHTGCDNKGAKKYLKYKDMEKFSTTIVVDSTSLDAFKQAVLSYSIP